MGSWSMLRITSSERSLSKKYCSGSAELSVGSRVTNRSLPASRAAPSTTVRSFTRRRYLLMKVLVRILKSHAFMLVPRSNLSKKRKARRKVSCTRSSASRSFFVRRRPAE
jgi:hypothetical protein